MSAGKRVPLEAAALSSRRCVCGANSGTNRFCAACDATMGARGAARRGGFAVASCVAALTLAGCVPADQPAPGVDGVTPHSVTPEDFLGRDGSAPPAPSGLFECDPTGFGPLSGCAHGTVTPNSRDAMGTVPNADPAVYIVTRKFHRGGEFPAWCVEARVPDDPQDRFSRDCALDESWTPEDQGWLDHQVVGQPVWTGAL